MLVAEDSGGLSTGWSQGLDADGPGLGGVKADGWEVALNGVELP